jgi:hypothetical protein
VGQASPIPPTAIKGRYLASKGGGYGVEWKDLPQAATDAILAASVSDGSYVIAIPVNAWVSGDTDWINQFFKSVSGTTSLAGVVGHVNSGTATVDVYQGNPNATTLLSSEGLNALPFTTTPTLFVPSSPVTVNNLDAFRIQITATTGGPLTATFFWTQS